MAATAVDRLSREEPLNVLLVVTRDPRGRQSGRKAVINTIINAMVELGHEVDVVVLGKRPATAGLPPAGPVRFHHLPPPGLARVALNILTRGLAGRLSLNECLHTSPSLERQARTHARQAGAEVVVADMIRTFPIASATGLPLILDLDDLLSERYDSLAGTAEPATILGYYRENLPPGTGRVLARLAVWTVRRESRVMRRRERVAAGAAGVVSLVAHDEARRFARHIGREVACLPMAVDVAGDPAPVADNLAGSLVFTGGLDYHANLEAIEWFVHEVVPALDREGLSDVHLTVVGYCPDEVRDALRTPRVTFAGYVDDLGTELRRHRAFVAPIRSGTGIKTKVVEAMAAGLPVITTGEGAKGLDVVSGRHCYVADDAAGLVRWIRHVGEDAADAAAVGAAGREHARRSFSRPVVVARWREVLSQITTSSSLTV